MIPSSVGEFFFGMTLAAFIPLGEIKEFHFLSEIGFLLLMYIAGLELDLDRMGKLNGREIRSYGGYLILLIAMAALFTKLFSFPAFFALVLMTTAIGLLYPVLKDIKMVKTTLGQTMIMLGAMGEVLTLVFLAAASIYSKAEGALSVAFQAACFAAFIAAVFISLKLLRLFLWWRPETLRFFMAVGNPTETGVRANLANMFIFAGLSYLLGIEPILGAFLGGLIFAKLFADREEILERLSGFGYGFLIPFFFIEVGSRFSFSDFTHTGILLKAALLAAIILLVRLISSLALIRTVERKKDLLFIALSQSFPLTMLVAAAATGLNNAMIDESAASPVILCAVITASAYPLLMKRVISVKKID
jgi:Kef-type K+ transport system membrane component KefB